MFMTPDPEPEIDDGAVISFCGPLEEGDDPDDKDEQHLRLGLQGISMYRLRKILFI